MKKILLWLLICLTALTLILPGTAEESSFAGEWVAVSINYAGMIIDPGMLGGESIVLNEDGTAVWKAGPGLEFEQTWSAEGDTVTTRDQQGNVYEFLLNEDGSLSYAHDGMVTVYKRSDASSDEQTEDANRRADVTWEEFRGDWTAIQVTQEGLTLPVEYMDVEYTLNIADDVVTMSTSVGTYKGNAVMEQGALSLDDGQFSLVILEDGTLKVSGETDDGYMEILFERVDSSAAEGASIAVGDTITFGRYEQDGDAGNGAEPIEWQVLAVGDSRALIISALGLEARSFSEPADVNGYAEQGLCWENSYLRDWLNDDFYNAAFTEEERASVLLTELETGDAFGSFTTEDKIFCLSIGEAITYFDDAQSMACAATAHAQESLDEDSGAISDDGYCLWLLRSMTSVSSGDQGAAFMSGTLNEVGYVEHDSGVALAKKGSGMPTFCDYLCVVRPAMFINLETADIVTTGASADVETTQEAAPVYSVLENGARGDEVQALQERLNELGYDPGTADGIFGNKTASAIEHFQTQNDLAVTGTADQETQKLLFSDQAIKAPIVRKRNENFSVNGLGIQITSVSFTDHYVVGSMQFNAKPLYLCVKLTVTNNTGHAIASSPSEFHIFDTYWEGDEQHGTYFPADQSGYAAAMWGLTDNYIYSGNTEDMIFLIDVPAEAESQGSLVLEFEDGSTYVVR